MYIPLSVPQFNRSLAIIVNFDSCLCEQKMLCLFSYTFMKERPFISNLYIIHNLFYFSKDYVDDDVHGQNLCKYLPYGSTAEIVGFLKYNAACSYSKPKINNVVVEAIVSGTCLAIQSEKYKLCQRRNETESTLNKD